VGFVVGSMALVQVFSKYFDIPCQSSFYQFLHNHHHLSSGAGSGRSTQSPTAQIKKKEVVFIAIRLLQHLCQIIATLHEKIHNWLSICLCYYKGP
jgi:hypothetical protein